MNFVMESCESIGCHVTVTISSLLKLYFTRIQPQTRVPHPCESISTRCDHQGWLWREPHPVLVAGSSTSGARSTIGTRGVGPRVADL